MALVEEKLRGENDIPERKKNAPRVKFMISQNYITYLRDAKVMWHVATVKHNY